MHYYVLGNSGLIVRCIEGLQKVCKAGNAGVNRGTSAKG
jgi:hypothetical protein